MTTRFSQKVEKNVHQVNDVLLGVVQRGSEVDQLLSVLVHEELFRHFVLVYEKKDFFVKGVGTSQFYIHRY